MSRPKDSDDVIHAKRMVARLIKKALEQGRSETTDPYRPQPAIDPRAFARSMNMHPTLGPKWCNDKRPTLPAYIGTILTKLFGNVSEFAEERAELLHWWRVATKSPLASEPAAPVTMRLSDYVNPVILTANHNTPDNDGNVDIPFTLRFQNAEDWEFHTKIDNQDVTLTLDVGLSTALFSVSSRHWQPAAESMFRVRPEPTDHVQQGPSKDSLWINGPTTEGVLVGHPFEQTKRNDEDVPLVRARFQREFNVPFDANGPITFKVHAPADALRVVVRGPVALSDRQRDVIKAIYAEPFRRDARDRLEVAHADVATASTVSRVY